MTLDQAIAMCKAAGYRVTKIGVSMVDTTDTRGSMGVASASSGAGAPEVEITPAMIEAGEETILASALRPEVAEPSWAFSLAREVYLAMEGARCSKRHQ